MNIWAWIGLLGIIFFSLIPFFKKQTRAKAEKRKSIITLSIAIGIIIAVLVFNINFLLAFIIGLLTMILFDKKTYTKRRLIMYSSMIALLGTILYILFRENPDYVMKHLKKNPESTSLYVAKNGETFINYESDEVRPLASTVKILIATEYALQAEKGIVNKETKVPLEQINRYYIENTDGGAHPTWLKAMKDTDKISNEEISLHEVAKGMIRYSSNANTDYLIDLLGIENINKLAETLDLTEHEKIYPIVSALLIPEHVAKESTGEKQLIKILQDMPMDDYRALAIRLSEQMKTMTYVQME